MADPTTPTFDATVPSGATINDVYAPLEQKLANNKIALENRYAQNKADIASITGVLTQVAPQDRQRINDQFTASLTQQQEALAGRTAEARKGQVAGQQAAATAAGELGSGGMPVPTDSWTNSAINQGISQSNQAQTNWAGLMGAMQQNQLGAVDATQAGYGFQVANALQQIARQRQTGLADIANQGLDLQSQKAGALLGAQAKGAEMAQESALAQAKNQSALDVAKQQAAGRMGAAQISAGASRANAALSAGTSRQNTLDRIAAQGTQGMNTNTLTGWRNAVKASGRTDADIQSMTKMAQKAYDAAYKIANKGTTYRGVSVSGTKTVKPSSSAVYQQWLKMYQSNPGTLKLSEPMQDYIFNFLKK